MTKKIGKILYWIGIPTFLMAILLTAVAFSIDSQVVRIIGITLAFVGGATIGVAFAFDFRETMIIKETQGDEFTLMSKEKLIELLDSAGIEYEEDKGREYYLYLVRENVQK